MLKATRWGAFSLMVVLGCGNGTGPGPNNPPPPDEDVTFMPPLQDVSTVPEAPSTPQEFQGDPGTLKVTVTFNGEAIESTVEVRRRGETNVVDQAQINASHAEHEFSLPPGHYDVRASFPGAIDNAADVKENLRIQTGRTLRADFAFDGVSAVTLECERGGRGVQGKVRLRRPGMEEWLPEVRCGEEFFIQGGSYEAEITIGSGRSGTIISVPELMIVGGGRVHTPVLIDSGRSH